MVRLRALATKSTAWLLIVVMMCNMLLSCTNDMFGLNKPERVELSASTSVFDSLAEAGGLHTLTGKVYLKSGETTTGIDWYIDNELVTVPSTYSEGIAVDSYSNGMLVYRIVKAGVYRIKAEASADSSKFAECVVQVGKPLSALYIKLGESDDTIVSEAIKVKETDGSFVVSAVLVPEDAYEQDVIWSVESNGVLDITRQTASSVDTAGNAVPPKATIRINSAGTAELTCRSRDNSSIAASVDVIVSAKAGAQTTKATNITVTDLSGKSSVEVPYGSSSDGVTIRARVTDGFSNAITRGAVEWSSDNPSAIIVQKRDSRSAILTAMGAGSAMITASFTDTDSDAPVTGEIYAYVSGAVAGIAADSELYRLQTGTTTGSETIRISYSPEDTIQKGYTAVSSDTSVAEIAGIYSDYLSVYAKSAGEAEITIASKTDKNLTDTFRIIVSDEVTARDRIEKITLSATSLKFEPPFSASNPYTLRATTWVREDSSSSSVAGDISEYGIRFEAGDSSVISIKDYGNGTASIQPLRPGETEIKAISLVDEDFSASAFVTVTGDLETLVASPSSISLPVNTEGNAKIIPVPSDALLTVSGEDGKKAISAVTDSSALTASVSLLPDNTLSLTVEGTLPGTYYVSILSDGYTVLTIPVTITAVEEEYVMDIAFSDSSVIMRQDSDPVILDVYAYSSTGERIPVNTGKVVFSIIEGGRIYSDVQDSDTANITIISDGKVAVSPRNSGVVILRAESSENSFVSGECRIEVGGSDYQGDDLRYIRPASGAFQVRKGSSAETEIHFIPSDFEDRALDWRIVDDGSANVRLISTGDATAEFMGIEPGHDIVQVYSEADRSRNTSFTIETVGEAEDAYMIVLDRYYLSFDRNQKAIPEIKATVTKNGRVVDEPVIWETEDTADVVDVTSSGMKASVALKSGRTTGTANITAKLKGNPDVYASCFVEVVDSYALDDTPRALVLRYSSASVKEGRSITIPYTIVPESADRNLEFEYDYSTGGIASASFTGKNFVIHGDAAGTTDITVSIKDTGVSDTIRVTVSAADTRTPASIRLTSSSVNLSQEEMDGFVSVVADVLDRNGNELDLPVRFTPAPASGRFFSVKTSDDHIDKSIRQDSGDPDYWGNDDIAKNEVRIKPIGAGSSYITASYDGVRSERIYVTVSAEEAIYQGVYSLIPSTDYVRMEKGEEHTVRVTPVPDTEDSYSISWASSDTKIASVSSSSDSREAVIRALRDGDATITASLIVDGVPVTASIGVSVETLEDGSVASVSVLPQHIVLDIASKDLTQLVATVTTAGSGSTSEKVEWTADPSLDGIITVKDGIELPSNTVLNISKTGRVTGSGYITASSVTDPEMKARALVEVVDSTTLEKNLSGIVLGTSSKYLNVGDTYRIAASPLPSSIASEDGWTLRYQTLDEDIASVSSSGTVTAVAPGSTEIEVFGTYGGRTESAVLSVTVGYSEAQPSYIEVTPQHVNLSQEKMDSYESIMAYVIGTDGNRMPDLMVEFSPSAVSGRYFQTKGFGDSIDTSKAPSGDADFWGKTEIAENELRIKPVSAGTSEIIVSYPGLPDAKATVTVAAEEAIYQDEITDLLPSTSIAVVETGSDTRIWVTAIPENDVQDEISWKSYDSSVATITPDPSDSRYAIIHGVKEGETEVMASVISGGKTVDSGWITVRVADDISGMITGMSVIPQHIILDLDSKDLTALTATVYRGGEADESAKVLWEVDSSMTDNGIISVRENVIPENNVLNISKNSNGLEGSGYITARSAEDEAFYSKAFVEVIHSSTLEKILSRIMLNAYYKELRIGDTFQLTAAPLPSSIAVEDGWDVQYVSSNDSVAIVSSDGLITAEGVGRAVITARGTYNDNSAEAEITIVVDSDVPASDIVLSDSIIEFDAPVGSKDINAELYDRNGDEITSSAVFEWKLDDESVADISLLNENGSEVRISPKKDDSYTGFTVTAGKVATEGYIIVGEPKGALLGLILDPSSIYLAVNEKVPVTLVTVPESAAENVTIRPVLSSNIMEIEDNGDGTYYISGVREGTGTVTFTASDSRTGESYEDIEAELSVRISGEARAERIEFNRDSLEFRALGDTAEVKARIISNTGNEFSGDVEWSMDDDAVASFKVSDDDPNAVTVTSEAAGSTVLRASYGSVKSSLSVSLDAKGSGATKPSSIYSVKGSVLLNHPDADAPEETKETTLEAGYYPQDLSDAYKGLIWLVDDDSVIGVTDAEGIRTSDGTLDIRAKAKGVTEVTAYSTLDQTVYTSFRVEVLDVDEVIIGGMPELALDKTEISIAPGAKENITASLVDGYGEDITDPGNALTWSIDDEEVATLTEVSPFVQTITAGDWAGNAIVTAKYVVIDRDESAGEEDAYITASSSVEVSDPDLEGQVLRSVSLDRSSLVMVAGPDTMRLRYTAVPNIGGVKATWTSSQDSVVTAAPDGGTTALLTAHKPGEAVVTVVLEQEFNGRKYTASAECIVTVTDSIPESGLYSSLTPSMSDISISPFDSVTTLTYALTNSDGTENSSTPIHEIRITGVNGELLERWTADMDTSTHPLVKDPDSPDKNSMFSFAWYPGERRMDVTPLEPGTGYIEAYVYDDPENPAEGVVIAHTYIAVTGDVRSVSLPASYYHLAEGSSETINVSLSPDSAIAAESGVKWLLTGEAGTAEASFDAAAGIWRIQNTSPTASISSPSSSSVILRADSAGDTVLTYQYTKNDGTVLSSSAAIRVDDPEDISGGVRKIAFGSSFMEIPYPYEDILVNAEVTFADGSSSASGIRYYAVNADGALSGISPDDILTLRDATGSGEAGVWLQAEGPGKAVLVAEYIDTVGIPHTATIEVTVKGAVSELVPSARNIVIYTGGSTVLSVTPDDDTAPGLSYRWQIADEHYLETVTDDETGEINTIEVPVPSSILELLTDYTDDGSSIIAGAKDVVTVDGGASSGYDPDLIATFPRYVKVQVVCPEYGIEEEINVTVELLPSENAYPMSLSLSSETLSITGTSTEYSEMTATVLDREGNETEATIDWYYYPISKTYDWTEPADGAAEEGKSYMYKSWLNPNTVADPDLDSSSYVYSYMREDAGTVFYRPLQAGQYRMKAIVRENPKLQAECTISVGPDVTGISTDAGDRLTLVRDNSRTITATFTPSNASELARDPVWILQSQKNTTADPVASDAWDDGFVSFTVNGKSISLRADSVTTKSSVLLAEYWDTDTTAAIKEAMEDGRLSVSEYREATSGGKLMYSAMLPIDVVPPTAVVQNLAISGLSTTIDPSAVESAIVFTVSANSSSSVSEAFSNWDWIDVDIIGNNTGYVYATTRMIDDPSDTSESQKKKIAACDWDEIGSAISEDGVINRSGNTFSFVLNPSGIPLEPVVVRAFLSEALADGKDEEGNILFDPEKMRFNAGQSLCYIGARLTGISQDTTVYNINNNVTESEGSQVNMILGASATLTVAYNPSQTHQKGVIWYPAGGDTSFRDYEFIPGLSQCSVFARNTTSSGGVRLRALSIYDPWFDKMEKVYGEGWRDEFINATPAQHSADTTGRLSYPSDTDVSLYCDYQIVITSPVEKTTITSRSQMRVNVPSEGEMETTAEYAFLSEEEFPSIISDSEVFCYDSVGITGGNEDRVDAYYIEPDYFPDFGYDIDYEIEEGAAIGSIDMTDIDRKSGNFRFVPNGPRPNADGTTSVTYGDVKIRFTAPDINYSELFTLHYLPSNMKLVKYIGRYNDGVGRNKDGSTVPDGWDIGAVLTQEDASSAVINMDASGEWDVARIPSENPEIYPLNALVLYPGESFDLSMISYTNGNPQYVTDGVTMDRTGEDDKDYRHYAVRYGVYSDSNASKPVPGYISFSNGYLNTDFRTEADHDTGLSRWYMEPKQTITAEKQGVVYLTYNVVPVSGGEYDYTSNEWKPTVDASTGQLVYPSADISSGEQISSGLWVYIVDPVDQMLGRVIENNVANGSAYNGVTTKIPERISLSQLRPSEKVNDDGSVTVFPSHWYMGTRGATNDSKTVNRNGQKYTVTLNQGIAYASFSAFDGTIRVDGVNAVDIRNTPFGTQGSTPSGYLHKVYLIDEDAEYTRSQSNYPIVIGIETLPEKEDTMLNAPRLMDVGIFGEYGLNRLNGVKAVDIRDDGSLTAGYIDENGTLDLSGLGVRFYKHSGMIGGTWENVGSLPVYSANVRKLIPPYQVEELRIPGNMLNLGIRDGGIAWSSSNRENLRVLDIGDNPSSSLTLSGFPNLWKVIASGSDDISTASQRKLTITDTPSLEVLILDDTQFTDVSAEFRDGKGSFYDASWPVILSARNSESGTGELDNISFTGGIAYADLGNSAYLRTISGKENGSIENGADSSDPGSTWIQYLNLLGKIERGESSIETVYGDIYKGQTGHDIPLGDDYSSVNTVNMTSIKLDAVGYLRGSTYYDDPESSYDKSFTEKGTDIFRLGKALKPYDLESADETVSYQGMMRLSQPVYIGYIAENAYVDIGYSGMEEVTVDYMYGTLNVTGSPRLTRMEINPYASAGFGTVIADKTGITDTSDVKARINTLYISDGDLERVSIRYGEPLQYLVHLVADGTSVDEYGMALDMPTGAVQEIIVDRNTKLEMLSVSGGGSLESGKVNIQGGNLRDIDLHNAGLYGDDWTIGSFTFISGTPWNNIDDYDLLPDTEYTKGYNLSQQSFSDVVMHLPELKEYTYTDSDSNEHTAIGVFVDTEYYLDSEPETHVDWKTWLPKLEHLRMHGNALSFQWITGNADFTISEALDAGLIEGYVTRIADNLYRPNASYDELYAKASMLAEANYRNPDDIQWFLETSYNERRFSEYISEEDYEDYRGILREIYGYKLVYDSEGYASLAHDTEKLLYSRRAIINLNEEFVWCRPGGNPKADVLIAKYFSSEPQFTDWRFVEFPDYGDMMVWTDFSFSEITENGTNQNPAVSSSDGHENDRFSIRFGTLDEELVSNPPNPDDAMNSGLQVYVHNKYKAGGGISQPRRGFLQIQGISGSGVYDEDGREHSYTLIDRTGAADKGIISDLDINGIAYTRVFDFHKGDNGIELLPRDWDRYGADKGKTPARFVMDGGTEGVLSSELLVDYRIYEEYYFAQYDHDSITLVYPFGV